MAAHLNTFHGTPVEKHWSKVIKDCPQMTSRSFGQFWTHPPSIIRRFITKKLVLSSQNPRPLPQSLKPRRHLWTIPIYKCFFLSNTSQNTKSGHRIRFIFRAQINSSQFLNKKIWHFKNWNERKYMTIFSGNTNAT